MRLLDAPNLSRLLLPGRGSTLCVPSSRPQFPANFDRAPYVKGNPAPRNLNVALQALASRLPLQLSLLRV